MGAGLIYFLVGTVITRVFTTVGIGIIAYTGFSSVMDQIVGEAQIRLGGLGYGIPNILGLAGIDLFINLVFSAYAALITIGTLKKVAFR